MDDELELNINRLKMLGGEKLEELDIKIKLYKNTNINGILKQSIGDINTKIKDLQSVLNNISEEGVELNETLANKKLKYKKLKNIYNKKYKQKNETQNEIKEGQKEIDKLRISITHLQNNITKLDYDSNKYKIKKKNISLEREKLTQKYKDYKLEYSKKYKYVRKIINNISDDVSQAKEQFLQEYSIVNDLSCKIDVDTLHIENILDRKECDVVSKYKSIKSSIIQLFAKHIYKFPIISLIYQLKLYNTSIAIESNKTIQGIGIQAIRSMLSKNTYNSYGCKFNTNKSKIIMSEMDDYLQLHCLCKKQYVSSDCECTNHQLYNNNKIEMFGWIKRNFNKILKYDIFENTHFRYIVENSTYYELQKLMQNDFDCKQMNAVEFVFFIYFIGTNGKFCRLDGSSINI